MTATNSLVYKASKAYSKARTKYRIDVTIRLNDEYKNGHQDFAITAEIYQAARVGWRWMAGGCCHEEIAKHFPEFVPFIRLHLSDYAGCPMHAVANGFYHLTKGLGDTKPEAPEFEAKYCEYYRINSAEFAMLAACQSQVQFGLALVSLGILDKWKAEAGKAIQQLEALTGKTFLNDSQRSQYIPPTEAEIKAENERIAAGYYTPEAAEARRKDAIVKASQKLRAEADAKIAEINLTCEIKQQVLGIGGLVALDNCIFYTHNKTLAFNWNNYSERLAEAEIKRIVEALTLPDGVTVLNESKTPSNI